MIDQGQFKIQLRNLILDCAPDFDSDGEPFVPGETRIGYSRHIFGRAERLNLAEVLADGWLTAGKWTQEFERKMRAFFGSRDFLLVNSGSSANLLMMATLCSPNVEGHLNPGDEVIVPALGFPTTLAPIVQCGLVPVFVDVELGTYNPTPLAVWKAINPETKAAFLPHPLGLPFDAIGMLDTCGHAGRRTEIQDRIIWLLEDGSDALGATFNGRLVGTFGAMSSLSHYPAHHISCGQGGSVVVNSPRVTMAVRSISEWGRACWCEPGKSNTCGKRFDWDFDGMPKGTDHKYIYTEIGYNLKATDMQAAVLCAQADRIQSIVGRRRENFRFLYDKLKDLEEFFILPVVHPKAVPSPYAFPLTVKSGSGLSRDKIVAHLEAANIETRPIFGGNMLRQPGFRNIRHRVIGILENTNYIMENAFFVGVHPGLTEEMLDYVAEKIREAVR